MRTAVLVGAVALVVLACGNSRQPGTPGTGGGGPTGTGGSVAGSGGVAATGGSGGHGGVPAAPSCLAQLASSCLLGGACTYSTDPNIGGKFEWCFGSGARVSREPITYCGSDPPQMNEATRLTIRKPDGSVCYTLEWTCSCQDPCVETGAVTWKDPAGNVVATGQTTYQSTRISCARGGETVILNCPSMDPFHQGCSDWPPGIVVFGHLNLTQGCEPATCP
jgi:hypothetical protein